MEIIEIIEFVNKAFNIETERIAYDENPVLFALYEFVAGNVFELYEIEHPEITIKMDAVEKEHFFKEKIIEHLDIRINQKK